VAKLRRPNTLVPVLDEILATKRDEVERLRPRAAALEAAAAAAPAPRDFAGALRRPGGTLAVIAEIKRRSPSKGALTPDLDPAATAARYAAGGAAALSVLTDGPFFDGSLADLAAARAACPLPVLRKDFTLDPVQVYEARAAGADAVLLIVAALPDDSLLADLVALAGELRLAALVEADDEAGVDRAVGAGATIVGVTNRDLRTFGEDLSTAERLAGRIPPAVVAVAESAIRTPADAGRMAAAGFSAILIGEALVRAPDPEAAVRELAAVPANTVPIPTGERR
jgi:indole-3-glycerol phosphate synthase